MDREPVVIRDAYAFTRRSSVSGADYRIAVAEPVGEAPPDGFPVVYLLDADTAFGTMAEAIRSRCHRPDATGVGAAVVVGIGYGAGGPAARSRRIRDFTPGPPLTPPDASVPGGGMDVGGAAAFLQFLEHDLAPVIASHWRIDPRRQVLFGHSLGGFFALWVLGTRAAMFRTVVAVSPSVWWNPPLLHDALRERQARRDADLAGRRVMITVGEFEQRPAPWQPADAWTDDTLRRRGERRMVDAARELAIQLRDVGAVVDFHEFAGEDHASVVILSIARALRFALPASRLHISRS